jgi:hypothetical protein
MWRGESMARRLPAWLRPAWFLLGFAALLNVTLGAFVIARGDDPLFIPYLLAVSVGASLPAALAFGLVREFAPGTTIKHWGAWALASPIGFVLVLILVDVLGPADEHPHYVTNLYSGPALKYVVAIAAMWGLVMAWGELRHLRQQRIEDVDLRK